MNTNTSLPISNRGSIEALRAYNSTLDFSLVELEDFALLLKVVKNKGELERVEDYRERVFRKDFPELKSFKNDAHDPYSIILYTENNAGKITSTARMVFDSSAGLPADDYAIDLINQKRAGGLNLLEVSRFAISDEAKKLGLLPVYYRAFYELCVANKVDSMIIVINIRSVNFHQKRVGAKMMIERIENIAGSSFSFACMDWVVKDTLPKFKEWVGVDTNMAPYPVTTWNSYSRFFASVYTDVQRKLYKEAVQYLGGHVIDLGCGPARLAPLLAEKEKVVEYTGVEYAKEMIEIAEFTLGQLFKPSFCIQHKVIEEVTGEFSSAVSLQSYYTWADPVKTLSHVFGILKVGSLFIIATPNPSLDQEKLFRAAKIELMWHPDFAAFEEHNMKLAGNQDAHFVTMDTLLQQLQSVGFKVEMCHQQHYGGGVNFVVCLKP